MHATKLLVLAALAGASATQAFAEDAMSTMTMMKGGQVTAIMPDGHMGTMIPDAKTSAEMMKMAKPVKHCMMMITDAKGKAYMIDTSSKKARQSAKKWRCNKGCRCESPAGASRRGLVRKLTRSTFWPLEGKRLIS
jgi:hypothetical protein